MPQKKENLLKLIQFIEEVSNEPGNEWFKNEIIKNYTKQIAITNFDDFNDESIKKIYEYCLKEIIRSQAVKFYENFRHTEIKDSLIKDFIRMEHYRRQDDFENFCLALFQQIENVVNYLTSFETLSRQVFSEKQNQIITRFDKDGRKFKAGITLGKLLVHYGAEDKIKELFSKNVNQWFFSYKLRTVLYYFCFNSEIKNNTDEFERLYEIGNYIYQMRNLNHRGGVKTAYQNEIINKVLPSSQKYFLRFLGFLEEFVSSIDTSTFNFDEINKKPANNFFSDNEVLKKIKEKLE